MKQRSLALLAGLSGRFIPAAALLISGGFFFSVIGKDVTRPNGLIALIYVGIVLLAVGLDNPWGWAVKVTVVRI